MAGFARCVLAQAAQGDQAALAIVEKNMTRLARYAAQMVSSIPEAYRVGLYGGVFRHSSLAQKLFADELQRLAPQAQICSPDVPPELGALIHLFRERGMLNETILTNLKTTYEEILP